MSPSLFSIVAQSLSFLSLHSLPVKPSESHLLAVGDVDGEAPKGHHFLGQRRHDLLTRHMRLGSYAFSMESNSAPLSNVSVLADIGENPQCESEQHLYNNALHTKLLNRTYSDAINASWSHSMAFSWDSRFVRQSFPAFTYVRVFTQNCLFFLHLAPWWIAI